MVDTAKPRFSDYSVEIIVAIAILGNVSGVALILSGSKSLWVFVVFAISAVLFITGMLYYLERGWE